MRKNKIACLMFMLFSLKLASQNFEGRITYHNSYKSKIANLSDEALNSLMGDKQEFYIKKEKLKNIFNGTYLKMQLFVPTENRIYTLSSKSDTLCWEDCKVIEDIPISYEIQKDKEKILNVMCDVLIVKTKKQKMYFYFNSGSIVVDATLFKDNNYNNWYYTISKTGALSYKTVIETDQFIAISIIKEISKTEIPGSFFDLPSSNLSKRCR